MQGAGHVARREKAARREIKKRRRAARIDAEVSAQLDEAQARVERLLSDD